jgi:hypothetical protein
MSGSYGIEQSSHLGGYLVGGDNETYCTEIWDWMPTFGIKSVIDIGCGEAHSTKYIFDLGIDVIGIEGGLNAYKNSRLKEKIILHDYTSGPFITKQRYDAVWCCEFVEHIKEEYVPNFLSTFSCAKYILMTHAVPNQGGYHHVNCQHADYWIKKLASINYTYDENITVLLRSITNKIHAKRILFFKSNNL